MAYTLRSHSQVLRSYTSPPLGEALQRQVANSASVLDTIRQWESSKGLRGTATAVLRSYELTCPAPR